jgi:PAS domain S-box-containing protein
VSAAERPSGALVGIGEVLVTAELDRRPSRAPDHAAENRVLAALATEMAARPGTTLQTLANAVLGLCRAGSAGISILEPEGEAGVFRRRAAAGAFAHVAGSTVPREASPCGLALARNSVLLLDRPERCFPALQGIGPPIFESLLAPFHVGGEPAGTVWAMAHDPERRFDAEDARVLGSLARFAAAAYQTSAALDAAERGRRELEARAEELANVGRAHRKDETRFRNALEIGTVGVIFFESAGAVTDANDAFLRMGGYNREDLSTGRLRWDELTPPEWMPASLRAIEEIKTRGSTTPYEKEYYRKDGSRWWGLFAAKALGGSGGVEFILDITDAKRAEAALRDSEARCRALATAGTYLIYRMSPDWRWMHQLDGRDFLADTPEPTEDWPGEYILPDDRPAVFAAIADAIRSRSLFELEHRVRRADGSIGWVLSRAVPMLGPEGEIVEWFGAATDVTERRVAQERLRASEERFRGFAENSADVLWIADRSGARLEYLSPAFERVFGEPRDRVMANLRRWRDLVHPDDRVAASGFMPRVLAGEVVIVHYRVVRPADSGVVHLRDTGFPIRGEDGAITRFAGIVQDITDIEQAAAALRAEKEHLRLIVENARDYAIFTTDPQDRIADWLPGAAAVFGWTAEEAVGRPAALLFTREDREAGVPERETETARKEGAAPNVRWHLRRDGSRVFIEGSATALHEADGSLRGFLKIGQDVTERREAETRLRESEAALRRLNETLEARVAARTTELMAAEESLRQSQKMEAVGQLTGGIAHDFNNMLQGIAGSLELTRRRAEQGRLAEAVRYVESARETVRRAAALTHRLLAFARQQTLAPAPVNVDALVRGMEELIRRTAGSAVQVEVRLGDGAWPVLCDESQLENALLNLCVNARDAMPGGGWLTISTGEVPLSAADLAGEEGAAPGAFASLAVTDTGSGMDEATKARVFEPFFTTKPRGQGTGLGLSQVYGFVRQSGGLVRVESAPGEGTTVRLFLPRYEPAEAGVGDSEASASAVVLLVEDEAGLRAMAAEWLREAGHRVLEAPDGAAALRLLHGGVRVGLLATDVGLPGGMNGRQVADAAREHRPGLPVLFMTGYAGDVLGGQLARGMEVLGKPFELAALAERVQAMLEAMAAP